MKKLLLGLLALLLLSNACSPAYVRIQPTYEEGFRPPRPTNNHVWVDGNWNYNRQLKSYNRSNGFWSTPYRGRRYQSGHWGNNSRGYYWNQGRWR